MKIFLFYFLFLFFFCFHGAAGRHLLEHKLRTWETITGDDIIFSRSRRSLDGKYSTFDKEVSFEAFQQRFTLSLMTSPEVFAPGFKAYVQGKKGKDAVNLDKSSIYKGTVLGQPDSVVHAHMQGKQLIASITTKDDTYIVEPSWRHLPDHENLKDNTTRMIVYRQSDLNITALRNHRNSSLCEIDELMKDIRSKEELQDHLMGQSSRRDVKVLKRGKRSAGRKKICTLALVADYRFYIHMGNRNTLETMYYLITLIERVNAIFKSTDWGSFEAENSDYTGYGFQIGTMLVHNISTPNPNYNSEGSWTAQTLLREFSKINHGKCLAHLFTYEDFEKGVLGLAYVGSSRQGAAGGICSGPYEHPAFSVGTTSLHLNTGLTTTKNWGSRILTLEADLVTTHELGHNFGAEHDDGETPECSPGESHNGNYIMYPAAVDGLAPNNKKFSICSKHNVLPVIKAKADCFVDDKNEFCGNFKVEGDEECDAGYLEIEECCTKDCKLRPGKTCSRKNYPCCVDCQVASSTTICFAGIDGSCIDNTYCNGKNLTCPTHRPKRDGTPCGDSGKCKDGECQPFCITHGKKPCLCNGDKKNMCMRCCAPLNSTGDDMIRNCKPFQFENGTIPQLRENARCSLGYCNNTECVKQTQDVIERVWTIFEQIAPDKIGKFLADNIVGAVLVFSLMFWVPCGCLVNFVDKRRQEQQRKEDEEWLEHMSDNWNPNGGNFGSTTAINKTQKSMTNEAGLNAKMQWNASKARGFAARNSQERLEEIDEDGEKPTTSGVVYNGRDDNVVMKTFGNNDAHGDAPVVTSRRISRPQLMRQDNTTVDISSPLS